MVIPTSMTTQTVAVPAIQKAGMWGKGSNKGMFNCAVAAVVAASRARIIACAPHVPATATAITSNVATVQTLADAMCVRKNEIPMLTAPQEYQRR